ncbi:MAG: VWA domain-containing protein [Caldilineae bacterium]|nr:VWA domain-containing protein [Caldilineae bacterium]
MSHTPCLRSLSADGGAARSARVPAVLIAVALATAITLGFGLAAGAGHPARAQGQAPECTTTRDKRAEPSRIKLGERVTVTLEVGGNCPPREQKVDVVLVIDRSSSMGSGPTSALQAAKDAATGFVDAINPQLVHVGVIAFDDVIEEMAYLSDDKAVLRRAIADIQGNQGTNLVDSLEAGRRMVTSAGARADAVKAIVFLTDGNHSVNRPDISEIDRVIAQVRADGIVTYAIGLGRGADAATLRKIAGDPDHFFDSPTPAELADIFLQIAGRIEAAVLFLDLTIEDIVPANMRYIAGSSQPPAQWDAAARSLTWKLQNVPAAGARLVYRVEPTEVGRHPTNVEARARYTDGFDHRGELVFPVPIVEVVPGETGAGCVCRITRLKAPQSAIDLALANPDRIWGWNRLLDEGKPGSPPWPEPGYDAPPNPRRTCLDIWNRGIPYHPLFNSVVWRAGCTEGPAAP